MTVAHRSLRHLRDQRLAVTQHQMQHLAVTVELFFKALAEYPVSTAGTLHNRAAGGALAPHKQRHTNHPIIAHHGNLRRRAAFHHIQQRHNRIGGEVDMTQSIARLVKHHTQRHVHQFKVGQQPLQHLIGQGGKEVILLRTGGCGHHCLRSS